MIAVLYLRPDKPAEIRVVEPVLKTFQGLVGGWIEVISGEGWCAYLNEEGKIAGLPVNAAADSLARRLGWESLPGDVLVGSVVFCGPLDGEGDVTGVEWRVVALAAAEGAGDV